MNSNRTNPTTREAICNNGHFFKKTTLQPKKAPKQSGFLIDQIFPENDLDFHNGTDENSDMPDSNTFLFSDDSMKTGVTPTAASTLPVRKSMRPHVKKRVCPPSCNCKSNKSSLKESPGTYHVKSESKSSSQYSDSIHDICNGDRQRNVTTKDLQSFRNTPNMITQRSVELPSLSIKTKFDGDMFYSRKQSKRHINGAVTLSVPPNNLNCRTRSSSKSPSISHCNPRSFPREKHSHVDSGATCEWEGDCPGYTVPSHLRKDGSPLMTKPTDSESMSSGGVQEPVISKNFNATKTRSRTDMDTLKLPSNKFKATDDELADSETVLKQLLSSTTSAHCNVLSAKHTRHSSGSKCYVRCEKPFDSSKIKKRSMSRSWRYKSRFNTSFRSGRHFSPELKLDQAVLSNASETLRGSRKTSASGGRDGGKESSDGNCSIADQVKMSVGHCYNSSVSGRSDVSSTVGHYYGSVVSGRPDMPGTVGRCHSLGVSGRSDTLSTLAARKTNLLEHIAAGQSPKTSPSNLKANENDDLPDIDYISDTSSALSAEHSPPNLPVLEYHSPIKPSPGTVRLNFQAGCKDRPFNSELLKQTEKQTNIFDIRPTKPIVKVNVVDISSTEDKNDVKREDGPAGSDRNFTPDLSQKSKLHRLLLELDCEYLDRLKSAGTISPRNRQKPDKFVPVVSAETKQQMSTAQSSSRNSDAKFKMIDRLSCEYLDRLKSAGKISPRQAKLKRAGHSYSENIVTKSTNVADSTAKSSTSVGPGITAKNVNIAGKGGAIKRPAAAEDSSSSRGQSKSQKLEGKKHQEMSGNKAVVKSKAGLIKTKIKKPGNLQQKVSVSSTPTNFAASALLKKAVRKTNTSNAQKAKTTGLPKPVSNDQRGGATFKFSSSSNGDLSREDCLLNGNALSGNGSSSGISPVVRLNGIESMAAENSVQLAARDAALKLSMFRSNRSVGRLPRLLKSSQFAAPIVIMKASNKNEDRRLSKRQHEGAYKFKEIVVKKCDSYTHVTLNTSAKLKNALGPQALEELSYVLNNARHDNTRVVLLTSSGTTFCSGLDLHYFLNKKYIDTTERMLEALRQFLQTLVSFPKPIVLAVNGAAVGLGAAILPLCDVVYASDKATFSMPYGQLGQTTEAFASYTFPSLIGFALSNEMLMVGRRLTATEACQHGLVSQVFLANNFMHQVVPLVKHMASAPHSALESTKMLLRADMRLLIDDIMEDEFTMLRQYWPTPEFLINIHTYLSEQHVQHHLLT